MFCPECRAWVEKVETCPHCGASIPVCEETLPSEVQENKQEPIYIEELNLWTAFISMFKRLTDFKGRSRRSEFWFAYLAHMLIGLVLCIPLLTTIVNLAYSMESGIPDAGLMLRFFVISIIIMLYSLIVFVPWLALMVRRLHDAGYTGLWLLICFVPFGGVVLFYFFCLDSQPGTNRYGKNPKGINES